MECCQNHGVFSHPSGFSIPPTQQDQAKGAAHSGGSCQIAFSYDKGETWVVAQSYKGDCPRVRNDVKGQVTDYYDTNQDYTFKILELFPSGERVIVAWLYNSP